MGSFFDDISAAAFSAVKDGAGNVVKSTETTLTNRVNGIVDNYLPSKVSSPLPEASDEAKTALMNPPASGTPVGTKDPLAMGGMSKFKDFYAKNKMLVNTVGVLLVIGLATGVIKLRGK